MSKFKVNDHVTCKETGEDGIIRVRNVAHDGDKTTVEYLVDFGGSIVDWRIMQKNQLTKVVRKEEKREPVIKEYDVDGKKLIMMACVEPKIFVHDGPDWFEPFYERRGKRLSIGFSIYNGVDAYDQEIGLKYARHRMKHNPFCHMESEFNGEFNNATVEAIVDAKANYIKEHWSEFYRPRQ